MATVFRVNGKVVSEREFLRGAKGVPKGVKQHHAGTTWPKDSAALGVHPDDIPAAREHAKRLGIPTEFKANGDAVITSQNHQKRYAEAYGIYDRNGGYGSPQPKVRTSNTRGKWR